MGYPKTHFRTHYSVFSLVRNAFGPPKWSEVWRNPDPKKRYKVVIVGGGGHGLATAYYLARNHGITDVAILEKGWLGGGNTGRNTAVVRSNYLHPESIKFFDFSLTLYEGLSRDLNYNIMLSQRGVLNLGYSRHDSEVFKRCANAMNLLGVDCEFLSPQAIHKVVPAINISPDARYPIRGGLLQRRGGIARHDAVAWGYARAADANGVDILQQCEVRQVDINPNTGFTLQTNRGAIQAEKVAFAVAGNSSVLASLAGIQVPIETCALQAFVSEPIKPVLDTVVMSSAVNVYVSQSDKGELVVGGGSDPYNSYSQRGSLPVLEQTVQALLELFPTFSGLRLMRQWAGMVDLTPDRSPIISETAVDDLYISCGWGTGGFKAIPAGGLCLAHLIATDSSHPLAKAFSLSRFTTGALIDEGAAAGVAH